MEKGKIKIWKFILLVILILLVVFIIITARKMIIIKNLQNKISNYVSSDNYHVTTSSYDGDYLTTFETYKNKQKSISYLTHISELDTKKIINYRNDEITNTYIESNNEKIAILNSNGLPSDMQISDWLYTDDLWQFTLMSIASSIKSDECNGKHCYKISLACSPNILYSPNGKPVIYIDKETGLMVRALEGTKVSESGETINIVKDYYYEFNNVTDEDIKEPDISQYKIQENN